MTDRDKLPAKIATGPVVLSTEQSGSLVARGLEAIKGRLNEPLSLPAIDPASLLRDAVAAAGKGEYTAAWQLLRPLAEQGNASAQYNLAVMCDKGQGVPQNYADAVRLYRLAADQGHTSAQFNLGVLHFNGDGMPRDHVQAHMWYDLAVACGHPSASEHRKLTALGLTAMQIAEAQKLAREWKPQSPNASVAKNLPLATNTSYQELYRKAERGDAVAQYNLGTAYYEGDGVNQNYVEAIKWWRKAALQWFSAAQYELGCAYSNGEGVKQDYVMAYMWFSVAWELGNDFGVKIFPNPSADEQRRSIEKFMTPKHIAEAKRRVRWWEKHHAS